MPRKKICMLAATPLTIHFFLKPHLVQLAKNHDVTLMVNLMNDSYLPPLELPITIIDIGISRKIAPISDLLCLMKLVYLFRKTKYDLLITVVPKAGLLGMLAGRVARIPQRLHIFQGEVWAHLEGFPRMLLKTCDSITAALATDVLAVSASERNFLIQQRVVNPLQIKVLGSGSIGGVDLTRFSPNPKRREEIRVELAIPTDAIVMIFIGRLVADKGIHELIAAHHQLSQEYHNLWLLLVGPDEGCDITKTESNKSQQNVRRVPFTQEPESYLAASDFLCLPSRREGFGVVIIEAAAMGLPTIGSNIYGISDAVINNKTGLLFQSGSVEELKASIKSLLIDDHLRNTLGANARNYVEQNYDSKKVLENYIGYIENLLHPKNNIRFRLNRLFDFCSALLAIIFLLPLILFTYLLVRFTSRGPVIYWSKRVGINNQIFWMPKFRSMKADAPVVASHLLQNPNALLTPVGSFIRKTSLDELPQLWCILIGDMSLVGPRPALFNQEDLIALRTQLGIERLKPGLTGWAQVNGRDNLDNVKKVDFDYQYLKQKSLGFDLKILWLTFLKVVRSDGVSH
ncbi:sugar transferase [Polynucleobacter asymbioticus]|nr:sugar transferase [Polynucleobacter asymbioticus]